MVILKMYSALRLLAVRNLEASPIKAKGGDQVIFRFSVPVSARLPMVSFRLIHTTSPRNESLMKKYETYLQDNFPRFYSLHRLVVDGTKSCFLDLKSYYNIRRDLNKQSRKLSDLSLKELAIYIQHLTRIHGAFLISGSRSLRRRAQALQRLDVLMANNLQDVDLSGTDLHSTREDLVKVLAIAAVAPLPMAMPTLALAIIFFPRFVLTRHFWTEDQRKQFWSKMIADQSKKHFPPLTRYIREVNPEVPVDVSTAAQFKVPPLEECSFLHLYHLTRIHGAFLISGSRSLRRRAQALQRLDVLMATNLEDVEHLSGTDLHSQLYLRKIYFDDYTTEERMRESLREWLMISPCFKSESVYLHLPVFLNYSRNKKFMEIDKN